MRSLRTGAFKPAVSSGSGKQRFVTAAPKRQQQQQRSVRAAVTAEVAAAVQQQAIAFAAVLGAETAFSLSNVPEGDPGRPQLSLVGAGIAGTLAATALVSLGGDSPLSTVGLAVGLLASGAMFTLCVDRVRKLEFADMGWPGESHEKGGCFGVCGCVGGGVGRERGTTHRREFERLPCSPSISNNPLPSIARVSAAPRDRHPPI